MRQTRSLLLQVQRRKRFRNLENPCRRLKVASCSWTSRLFERGAQPKVESLNLQGSRVESDQPSKKLERIAMREVEEGRIVYDLPSSESKAEDTTAKG